MKTGLILALLALIVVWVWASGKGGAVLTALLGGSSSTSATTTSSPNATAVSQATTANQILALANANDLGGFASPESVGTAALSYSGAVGQLSIPSYIALNGQTSTPVPTYGPSATLTTQATQATAGMAYGSPSTPIFYPASPS